MSTLYPAALDAFSNPTPGQSQAASRTHSEQHSDLNDAVEAMQAAMGAAGTPGFPGQLRADLAADDPAKGAALVAFKQSGLGATLRDMMAKSREHMSLFDYIPETEHAGIIARTSTYDCSADIQDAIDEAADRGGAMIHAPAGQYCMASGVTVTDALVYIVGEGPLGSVLTTGTVFKAIAAIAGPMFKFGTASLVASTVPVTGGLSRCTLNGNSLAQGGLNIQSVTYGCFEHIRMYGQTVYGLLGDCGGNGAPSCQYNWIDQIFITAGAIACDCVIFKGNEEAGGFANFSLNNMGSIFTLDFGPTGTGHGIVWKSSDGNMLQFHRHFGQGAGRGQVHWGSDVDTAYSSRHNVIGFAQTGPAGILAKSGTLISSGPNRIIMLSQGNGTVAPTVETGAQLAWQNTYAGSRGTFTPTLSGQSVAGTPTYTIQKGRWSVQGNRLFFDAEVAISAIGGISGVLRLGGFPFVMSNASGTDAICSTDISQWALTLTAGNTQLGGVVQQGNDFMLLFQSGTGIASSAVVGSQLMATSKFVVSGSYPMQGA